MKRKSILVTLKNKIISLISKVEIEGLKIDSIIEDTEKGLLYLVLRINGKCTPPIKKMPYELLMENGAKTSSMLSQQDFIALISAMLENQKRIIEKKYSKIYTLINHKFSEQNGEPLLVYKNLITSQYHIKSAKDVFTNINLIQNFDSKDCACIGNIVGIYEAEKELRSHHHNVVKFDNSVLIS